MAALTLVGKASQTDWIWDYECDCGLRYRVRAVGDGASFWPSNGARSFSHRSVEAGADCVKCGRQLTLEGCVVRDDADRSPRVRRLSTLEPRGPATRLNLRCSSCGYGAIASSMPAQCPMCAGTTWDFADWKPFTR